MTYETHKGDNMASNLFGNRFYGHREEAWHKLGIVTQEDMTANEVLDLVGRYEFVKRPLIVELNGAVSETGDFAIVRTATHDDPIERSFGYITQHYNIIQPSTICELFDQNVNQPVETMGMLGNGEKLFLSWKLPLIDIKGDEIKMYGLVAVGYDGKYGANLHLATTRTVCENTLALAISENDATLGTGRVWSGRHNSKKVEINLGIWLEHVQTQAEEQASMVKGLFLNLESKKLTTDNEVKGLLAEIYPLPAQLPAYYPKKLVASKQQVIDSKVEEAERDRSLAYALFAGAGTKINDTAFGLLNAVVEYENYGGTVKKPIEYSVMFGNRNNNMNRALNVIKEYAFVDR